MKGTIILLLGAFIGLGMSLIFKKRGIYLVLITILSAFLFYKFRFVSNSIFFLRVALAIFLFIYSLCTDTSKLKINPLIIKILMFILLLINIKIYTLSKVLALIMSAALFYLIFFFLKRVGKSFKKVEMLGDTDLLLIAFTGLYLNFLPGLKALLIATLLALPLSIYIMKKKNNSRISFTPFIVLGLLLVDYYG